MPPGPPERGSSRRSAGLILRVSRDDGRSDEFYLADGLTIGRSLANTIVLADDDSVDRTHARVELAEEGGARIRCLEPHGSLSVGEVTAKELPLEAGVRFRIGKAEFHCIPGRRESEAAPDRARASCPFCGSTEISTEGQAPRVCPGCQEQVLPIRFDPHDPVSVLVPASYGGFRAERFVDRGGMGVVLEGTDEAGGHVAIKVLRPGADDERRDAGRFEQEVAMLTRVRHPNVVKLHDHGRSGRYQFLAMEWIEGPSLHQVIADANRNGKLADFSVAARWFEQVAKGLAAIHSVGLVHRDIKPSNVLIGSDGVARIADLGIARRVDVPHASYATADSVPGTVAYMAPEQLDSPDAVDGRADLYALGITFHELLTGTRPVGAWRPASVVNPSVPGTFDEVLGRLLAPRPDDRCRDIYELLSAISVASPSATAAPHCPQPGNQGVRPTVAPSNLAHHLRQAVRVARGALLGSITAVRWRGDGSGNPASIAARNGAVWGGVLLGSAGAVIGIPACLVASVVQRELSWLPMILPWIGVSALIGAACGGLGGVLWKVRTAASPRPHGPIQPVRVGDVYSRLSEPLRRRWIALQAAGELARRTAADRGTGKTETAVPAWAADAGGPGEATNDPTESADIAEVMRAGTSSPTGSGIPSSRPDDPGAGVVTGAGASDPAGDPTVGRSLEPGAQPVPGYRLVEPLGQGRCGVVWKARGPGGRHVALRFVSLARSASEGDRRVLELIKAARHPNLLAVVGIWQRNGALIIATELAEGTLLHRLQESLARGLPGIPALEIYAYLREAAEGIDFLNETRHRPGDRNASGIGHGAIGPHNLMLVDGKVKVAEFGLTQLREQGLISPAGSMTVSYVAPEFIDRKPSSRSDQYSLAVTYCRLRGDRLPFTGSPARSSDGHGRRTPDLTMLPQSERAAVARALDWEPGERWPNCRAWVAALVEGPPAAKPRSPRPEKQSKPRPAIATSTSPNDADEAPAPRAANSSRGLRPLRSILMCVVVLVAGYLGVSSWPGWRRAAGPAGGPISGPPEPPEPQGGTAPNPLPPDPGPDPGPQTQPQPQPETSPAASLVGRARAYWKLRPEEAIAQLTEAIRLDPGFQPAYYLRGSAYFLTGDLDRAIADFDESIRLNPEKGGYAQNMRGRAYARKGLYHRALLDMDEAIRLNPGNGVFYFHRGEIRSKADDSAGGEADHKKAFELDPDLEEQHPGIAKKRVRRDRSPRKRD